MNWFAQAFLSEAALQRFIAFSVCAGLAFLALLLEFVLA